MTFLISQFIILIGLAVFTYLSWRKIELGIMAIVFCLPLYLARLNIFGIPSTVLELEIYILFIVWLFKNYRRIKLNEIIPDKMLLSGIFLLMAGVFISTFFSADLKISAGILKGWFFDPLLFFIILVSVIKNSSQAENVLKVFSLSGFAIAAVGLLYWFGFFPNGVSYDGRLHGFYSSPNYLAMYLAVPFIVSIWLFFLSLRGDHLFQLRINSNNDEVMPPADPPKADNLADGAINTGFFDSAEFIPNLFRGSLRMTDKYFWLIIVLITAIAIYFTYSYAAWLAIFFAVILLFCFIFGAGKKPSFHWKLGFLSIFLVLLVLFFSQIGTDKFKNLKNLSYRSSGNSRIMIWRSALMIGQDYPIFGIGPGNFQRYYLDYQKKFTEPYLEWAVPQPHNIFLAFWLETGILGLAGFVLILGWFFRSGILIIKESRLGGIRGAATVLLSIMAYILLHGLVDTTYWKNDLAMIFWLVLGLMVVIKNNR